MVDNRSAGFFGIGGSFNFRSGDISGTAAKTQDDKMGQGSEYYAQEDGEEQDGNQKQEPYTDRSAQLRATLNSLAMMNVANVINSKKAPKNKKYGLLDIDSDEEYEKFIKSLDENLENSDEDEHKEEEDNEYY